MPKIKTRKSVQKRIKGTTADDLLRLRKMSAQHRRRFKSKRSLQNTHHGQTATKTISKKLSHFIGKK